MIATEADRPDYQEAEMLWPPEVEHFPNGKRVVTYRRDGRVELIDESIYDMSAYWNSLNPVKEDEDE